jgi:hypothetical protein
MDTRPWVVHILPFALDVLFPPNDFSSHKSLTLHFEVGKDAQYDLSVI